MPSPPSPQSLDLVLRGAIDYAGLFPPASLAMNAAVDNYGEYRASQEHWALGRFIVSAGRLTELSQSLDRSADRSWTGARVSVTLGSEPATDLVAIAEFNTAWARADIAVDAVEIKLDTPEAIDAFRAELPTNLTGFVEIGLEEGRAVLLDRLIDVRLAAKIRMGGVTPDLFPPAELVAGFLVDVAARRLPFKATAGLHHPLRGQFRLTYAEQSPSAAMYGFLNLIVATLVALDGGAVPLVATALLEATPGAIVVEGSELRWRDHRFGGPQFTRFRTAFRGFGSCSFREPMDELEPALSR